MFKTHAMHAMWLKSHLLTHRACSSCIVFFQSSQTQRLDYDAKCHKKVRQNDMSKSSRTHRPGTAQAGAPSAQRCHRPAAACGRCCRQQARCWWQTRRHRPATRWRRAACGQRATAANQCAHQCKASQYHLVSPQVISPFKHPLTYIGPAYTSPLHRAQRGWQTHNHI